MAIVQISRIQHRRGRKGDATSVPQLASGELGWAVDTQELYIGNGSVSEGAPAIGNTKILTTGDDLFALADQYTYRTNSIWSSDTKISRSLQSKLDDIVSVFDFGATGDGTDQTVAIRSAINKLYKSTETSNRVILQFPAGEYTISSTIELPPFVTLRGEGKGKTIINANNCDMFKTIHYDPNATENITPELGSQARYIEVTGMTLTSNSKNTILNLDSCNYSVFRDLRFKGTWSYADPINDRAEQFWSSSKAILLDTYNSEIICRNNIFSNIEIDGFFYAVYSNNDIMYNTFSDMNFFNLGRAIGFGELEAGRGGVGRITGPVHNTFERSIFDRIDTQALNVEVGEYNTSRANQFFNVGNFNAAEDVDPNSTSIIDFASYTNVSMLDFFKRLSELSKNQSLVLAYPPEIAGRQFFEGAYINETVIGNRINSAILQFPLINSGTIFVDYVYTEVTNSIVKEGTLEIISNTTGGSEEIAVTDEFNFSGNNAYADDLTFSAVYSSNSGIDSDTITLLASNTIPSASDTFLYNIRVKSN